MRSSPHCRSRMVGDQLLGGPDADQQAVRIGRHAVQQRRRCGDVAGAGPGDSLELLLLGGSLDGTPPASDDELRGFAVSVGLRWVAPS